MRATYNPYDRRLPAVIGRYWTRLTYWDDGATVDNPARSAKEAMDKAANASRMVRADVDAMDGAKVLATFRQGKEL